MVINKEHQVPDIQSLRAELAAATTAPAKLVAALAIQAMREAPVTEMAGPAEPEASPQADSDRQYLTAILEGTYSLNDPDLFTRLEEIGGRYGDDPAMMGLFTQAAEKVTNAAAEAAKAVL